MLFDGDHQEAGKADKEEEQLKRAGSYALTGLQLGPDRSVGSESTSILQPLGLPLLPLISK